MCNMHNFTSLYNIHNDTTTPIMQQLIAELPSLNRMIASIWSPEQIHLLTN
jgi:hypothetical protein